MTRTSKPSQMTMPKPALVLILFILATAVQAQAPQLQCDVGPVTKTFASAPWLVYSCNDGKSVVIVSAPGSPASPFYFMFSPQGGAYRLIGEGTDSNAITDAALSELKALTSKQIESLLHETQAVRKP